MNSIDLGDSARRYICMFCSALVVSVGIAAGTAHMLSLERAALTGPAAVALTCRFCA